MFRWPVVPVPAAAIVVQFCDHDHHLSPVPDFFVAWLL